MQSRHTRRPWLARKQMEHARAFAELMSCSVKQMGKDREDEKVAVDQGEAIKLITLAALPNDCR